MTRASNEAETGRPTVEQEMSAFKGFSTENGETITPDKPEDLNPVAGKNMTPAEIEAAANKAGKVTAAVNKGAEKVAVKEPAKLTDEESAQVISDLDTKLGREATEKEIAEALKAAANKASGKPAASVQDRINKAIKNQRSAERRAATAERERDEARAALTKAPLTAAAEKDKTTVNADEAPDPKKFEYGELDAGYIRALARYEAKQEIAEAAKTEQTKTLTAQQQSDKTKFEAARAEFEDKGAEQYDDFDEVVMQGARDKAWPLSDTLGAVLMASEFGPQIAYELASDPKEAKRVYDMPAMRQVAWLGRKEAELESAGSGAKVDDEDTGDKAAAKGKPESKTAAKVSKAPTPITRARGQGSASSVPGDTADFAAFEAVAMGRTK